MARARRVVQRVAGAVSVELLVKIVLVCGAVVLGWIFLADGFPK
jgi:hypothetical protein